MSIFNLVLSAVMIVGTPILITQVLGMSDTMYGFTQGALALGGLCGGILTAIVSEKLKIKIPMCYFWFAPLLWRLWGFPFF